LFYAKDSTFLSNALDENVMAAQSFNRAVCRLLRKQCCLFISFSVLFVFAGAARNNILLVK